MDREDKLVGLVERKACDVYRCPGCGKVAWLERDGQFMHTPRPTPTPQLNS
jgi:uncharacterized protein with PIN domain